MFLFIAFPLLAVASAIGASIGLLGALMKLDKSKEKAHVIRLSLGLAGMTVHFAVFIFAAIHTNLTVAMSPFFFVGQLVFLGIGFAAWLYYKVKAPI